MNASTTIAAIACIAATAIGFQSTDAQRASSSVAELVTFEVATAPAATAQRKAAMGFDLGSTQRADVLRWAADRGVRCLGNAHKLSCDEVPGERAFDSIELRFDNSGKLVQAKATSIVSGDAAHAHFASVERELNGEVGPATDTVGACTHNMSTTRYSRAHREYRYDGYVAEITATNYASRGIKIVETYRVTS